MIYNVGAELPVWAPLAVPIALRALWQMTRVAGWWWLGWPLVGRLRRRRMTTADAESIVSLAHGGDATITKRQWEQATAVLGEVKAQLYQVVQERDDARRRLAELEGELGQAARAVRSGRPQRPRAATEAELVAAVDHPAQTLAQFTQYDPTTTPGGTREDDQSVAGPPVPGAHPPALPARAPRPARRRRHGPPALPRRPVVKAEQQDTAQDLTDPEVARLRLLDHRGAVERTLWSARHRRFVGPPLSALIHHHQGPNGGLSVTVDFTMVADDRFRAMLADAAGREHGGVALDVWKAEEQASALAQGYRFQHWLLPWLVVGMPKETDRERGVYAVVDDPGRDVVARCVALENPRLALAADLWWPTYAPSPVRAYQWIREAQVPPVPG